LLAQQILSSQSTHSRRARSLHVPSSGQPFLAGNLRELRAVLLRATLAAGNDIVYARDLPSFARKAKPSRPDVRHFVGTRLDSRCAERHRYRRTETARFLGLSRKTLYNKICTYELYPEGAKSDRS